MKRLVPATLVWLSAAAYFTSGTQPALSKTIHSTTKQSAVLYRADFKSKGLQGWFVDGSWKVNRQGIVTVGSGGGMLLAPSIARLGPNFAIQATIKLVGKLHVGEGYGYALVVLDTSAAYSGVFAGPIYSPATTQTAPLLNWQHGVQSIDEVGGANPTLRPGYHTYRLEVHQADYALVIDGHPIVHFTFTKYRAPRLGVDSLYQKLQIKAFEVTRIPAATPLPTLPPVKAVNLSPADVSSSFKREYSHYSTNEELSRLFKFPLNELNSSGLLISHNTSYDGVLSQPPASSSAHVISFVYGFASSQDSQQWLRGSWLAAQKGHPGATETNYTADPLSGLGDEAYQITWDDSFVPGETLTVVEVLFRRGVYGVEQSEEFFPSLPSRSAMISQTTALAKIVDEHIQQRG